MTGELILLPRPRSLVGLEGTHTLQTDRYLWLGTDVTPDLLRIAKRVKESLAMAGPSPELTAAPGRKPGAVTVTVRIDPRLVPREQGYLLTVLPEEIRVVGHDPAGAFYAAMTLEQIARQSRGSGELPCLRIEDWPDFAHRGVMLCISRDKVFKMETLYSLVDMLAEWKVNQLQLYTEHTFAYRDHRDVWKAASPMTGEEVLELDSYCRDRFVELVPNQNSFGHMGRWLMHPGYVDLAEDPDTELPRALDPADPRSIQLIGGLYDELLPHFSSRQFNVGCDEVALGHGRSKEAVRQRGSGRVYLEFLLKIHEAVRSHGRTMQFFADMILRHPELIRELPGDIIALDWGYETDHPWAEEGQRFVEAGVPFYVCPGTSAWNSFTGQTDKAMANIWNAAENGLEMGAVGMLNTDWGGIGHLQHLPVSYLGYAYGAAVSWATQANRDIDLARALDVHAFRDTAGVMGRLAYDLGNAYQYPGVLGPNGSVLYHVLFRQPQTEKHVVRLTAEGLERTEAYTDSVMSRLHEARMECSSADTVADEFRNAADLVRHACHLASARLKAVADGPAITVDGSPVTLRNRGELPSHVAQEIARMPSETRRALAAELEGTIDEYRRLWLLRNRPGGLDDSTGRWKAMLDAYRDG